MANTMLTKIASYIKKSAIYLLFIMVNILIITTLLFCIKVTVTPLHLPIIYILSTILFILFYICKGKNKEKKEWKEIIIAILIGTIIFGVSVGISGSIYDTTADGNTYHKLAIGALKNGWNPNYESSREFTIQKGNVFDVSDENINALWVDHYAKATEIFASVIYAFTGNIESGKAYTILLMYITFGIIFSYLYKNKKMNLLAGIAIAFIIAFNPITIVQISNFYVDGTLCLSLFLILYACFSIGEDSNEDKELLKENFFILASSIIWCINAKFTGLAFAGIFCCAFYFYWLYKSYKEDKENFRKKFITYTCFYVITVIIAIVIVGFSSYMKNTIDYGNPLYPLYGKNHVDNMVVQEQPKSFKNKNHIEIFLISMFSKGQNVSPSYSDENIEPELKVPFTFSKEEVKNYSIPDIRMAGFGPLFSGVFIITCIIAIVLIIQLIRKKQYNLLIPYLITLGITTLLLIILDGNYWARYIPYVFVIPVFSIIYLLANKNNKLSIILGTIISIIMIINVGLICAVQVNNIKVNTAYAKNILNQFKDYAKDKENVNIQLNHWGLQGVLYNLDDMDIHNYTVKDEIQGEKEGYFFKYE